MVEIFHLEHEPHRRAARRRQRLRHRLLDDPQRLPHLLHAHHVPVARVARLAYGHVEVEPVVHEVRLVLPQVARDARARPKHRHSHADLARAGTAILMALAAAARR